jgi:hypothetical protein
MFVDPFDCGGGGGRIDILELEDGDGGNAYA